jgi:hypothetical protein
VATALVSKCSDDMLTANPPSDTTWCKATRSAAYELTTGHLDSCATHCFVSSAMSDYLRTKGYPPTNSPIRYDVVQGNPLCSTRQVHYVPLSLVRDDGTTCSWRRCLFIVADAGAPIIICNPLLRAGSILRYDPPSGYERLLLNTLHTTSEPAQGGYPAPPAQRETSSHQSASSAYGPPDQLLSEPEISAESTRALKTTVPTVGPLAPVQSPSNSPGRNTKRQFSSDEENRDGLKNKKIKGHTDMLTPSSPYGKNPPLPDEVLEAVKHLKLLADPRTSPIYSPVQIEELRSKFLFNNPQWGNCLTVANTLEVSDKETELFINDLMDKPRYQKSIFSPFLDGVCDLGEYEINQKPGRDTWAPAQPRRFRSPEARAVVDDWLDNMLRCNKVRESKATHPAPVTVVEKENREPRICFDYRNRNTRTEVPVFPMPDVLEFLDDTAGFKHYCSFDMAKMFQQFRIKEEHKHLAAFITHRGVYEPHVVLFGLAGGPQHAVRECGGAMAADPLTNGIAFTEWAVQQNKQGVQPPYEICPSTGVVKGSRLKPFIDDVTIPSNHTEGMKKLVEYFFEFCLKHNLTLSRKKTQVMKRYLRMLGFVVSEEGKHLDPHRIITLLEAPKPRSKETLHALLSSFTFVRMFIPNFASIAAPLYEATKGIV